MGASRIPPPPSKDDARFDDWLTKLWQAVSPSAASFTGLGVGTATIPAVSGSRTIAAIGPDSNLIAENVAGASNSLSISQNAVFNSTWKYIETAAASDVLLTAGTHVFRVAVSGTAGAALTWVTAGTIDNTGNFLGAFGITSSNPSSGVGYAAGAGGTITQLTSKSTGVTLNKVSGQITTVSAALASAAKVTFTVTNSACAAADIPVVVVVKGGTANAYRASVAAVAAGSFAITLENITAGSLTEQPVIGFNILKGAIA